MAVTVGRSTLASKVTAAVDRGSARGGRPPRKGAGLRVAAEEAARGPGG